MDTKDAQRKSIVLKVWNTTCTTIKEHPTARRLAGAMVEFGKTLRQARRPEWEDNYLDYEKLKNILIQGNQDLKLHHSHRRVRSLAILSGLERAGSDINEDDSSTISSWKTSGMMSPMSIEFKKCLDSEIEKVVLFSLQEQGRLAALLSKLNTRRQVYTDQVSEAWQFYQTMGSYLQQTNSSTDGFALNELNHIREAYRSYQSAAQEILLYVQFCEVNVTAVRKILKKHDKFAPRQQALSEVYLSTIASSLDSHLQQLYHFGGLSALTTTLQQAFFELHQAEVITNLMIQGELPRKIYNYGQSQRQKQHQRVYSMPLLLSHGDEPARNLSMPQSDDAMVEWTIDDEPLLCRINAARSSLRQSTKYVELIAAQALFFQDDGEDLASLSPPPKSSSNQRISSFLNLSSTFLYMTNYYIVAPTTGHYALQLGASEAWAAIIIGMTPNAALIATVLYGWWSNYSYKSALIFAAGSSILGNAAYALALHYNSLTLVMVGRFLNGFGSARSINRRFIADTFSRGERTAASAAFVMTGGMGMAAGPAIAALLGVYFTDRPITSLMWTPETAPGWVMLVLWSIFIVVFIIYFEEPDRSHIFETEDDIAKGTNGEKIPLISTRIEPSDPPQVSSKSKISIYRNVPVMMTLWIYFILKLVLECLLSSSATLTRYFFSWESKRTGTFLAFLGALMIPANMIVAQLSRKYEDRELIVGTLVMMLISLGGILQFTSNYSVFQYSIFGVCLFVSANVLEGPNMSLLSKSLPKDWAKGIFNSGFLATESGTAARSVGDILISVSASIWGVDKLLNATFVPIIALVGGALWGAWHYFDQLIEDDEDDDMSTHSSKIKTSSSDLGHSGNRDHKG